MFAAAVAAAGQAFAAGEAARMLQDSKVRIPTAEHGDAGESSLGWAILSGQSGWMRQTSGESAHLGVGVSFASRYGLPKDLLLLGLVEAAAKGGFLTERE